VNYVEKHILVDGKIMVDGDRSKGEPLRREATPLEAYKIVSPYWVRVQETDVDEDIDTVGDFMDDLWWKMSDEEQEEARRWTEEAVASGKLEKWMVGEDLIDG